jgi:hypothetical protein
MSPKEILGMPGTAGDAILPSGPPSSVSWPLLGSCSTCSHNESEVEATGLPKATQGPTPVVGTRRTSRTQEQRV